MSIRFRAVLALFVAVFFLSVASSYAFEKDLAHIFGALDANPLSDSALADLKAYVEANVDASGTDEGLLKLARTYMKRKEYNRANDAYEMLIDRFPGSRFRPDAFFELAGRILHSIFIFFNIAHNHWHIKSHYGKHNRRKPLYIRWLNIAISV